MSDGSEQVWVVDKARIVASFAIAWNGVGLYDDARAVVERIRVPSYVETDERGVLRAVWAPERNKTESCLWCGKSEALGAVLKEKPNCFGGRSRWVCVDSKACEAWIKRQILLGP